MIGKWDKVILAGMALIAFTVLSTVVTSAIRIWPAIEAQLQPEVVIVAILCTIGGLMMMIGMWKVGK